MTRLSYKSRGSYLEENACNYLFFESQLMKRFIHYAVFLLTACSLLGLGGCRKKVLPVTVHVPDSIRHYYPIVAGDQLEFSYMLYNTGNSPLIIDDVQPSCGCISHKMNARIIPPGDTLKLSFTFDSSKNVGYVRHAIRLFGNILPKGIATLIFDVNIVPPSDHYSDYEEYYKQERAAKAGVEDLVDGTNGQKGYYVDPADKKQPVEYPWME